MKKYLFLLCMALVVGATTLKAQDDMEAIVSDDIEVEGLENFWIECSLHQETEAEGLRHARPRGGSVQFLTHVQKCMAKVVSVLFDKYPEEMLGMLGRHENIYIDFAVKANGDTEIVGITNGAVFAVDSMVANKIFNSYKKWRPAKRDKEPAETSLQLKIDISI